MKIVACIKRVPTTEAQVKVAADGKSLDNSGFQYMTSFYDEIAVEEAVKTKEAQGGEVVVLTIGPKEATKEMRECLAKGADAGVLLLDPDWMTRDSRATAKALAQKIGTMGADVIFVGRVATDRDNASVGPMLATYLDLPCVTEVVGLELADGKGKARCETEAGVEIVEFSLPAVIACDKGLNEPRYAGMKGVMAAKKKTIEEEPCPEIPNQAVVRSVAPPPARKEGRIVGEGVDAVPALMSALRDEAKVL
jgi:electron transfer flavoprotein beta subunit